MKKCLLCFIVCIYLIIGFQIYTLFLKDLQIFPHDVTFPKGTKNYTYTSDLPRKYVHNRVAVFASFSSTGQISEYVVRYLQELTKVTDIIIFIADNPIFPTEAEKIKGLVSYMQFKRHGEYDFGSYKRGLAYLRKHRLLSDKDFLILANDSCYAGVYPFKPIFKKMEKNKFVDFWGMASNSAYKYHLQSYFLVFSPKILSGFDLDNFLNKVRKQKQSFDVVLNYEIPLTEYFNSLGYTSASYIPDIIQTTSLESIKTNKTFYPYSLISKYHFPLIKRKVFFPDDGFAQRLSENPEDVMNFLKTHNQELYKIIHSEQIKSINADKIDLHE